MIIIFLTQVINYFSKFDKMKNNLIYAETIHVLQHLSLWTCTSYWSHTMVCWTKSPIFFFWNCQKFWKIPACHAKNLKQTLKSQSTLAPIFSIMLQNYYFLIITKHKWLYICVKDLVRNILSVIHEWVGWSQ